jgi:hypothetical protein
MTAALMEFRHRPAITWRPLPGPKCRINWCGLCGGRNPALFDVPDIVWRRYIPPEQRWHVVCRACWDRITDITDGGAFQAEHGGPLALWSDQWRARHGIGQDTTHTPKQTEKIAP